MTLGSASTIPGSAVRTLRGGVAVVAYKRPDMGCNSAVTDSTSDSLGVSSGFTKGEEGCQYAFSGFGDAAVVKVTPLFRGNSGSATSLGGMT